MHCMHTCYALIAIDIAIADATSAMHICIAAMHICALTLTLRYATMLPVKELTGYDT